MYVGRQRDFGSKTIASNHGEIFVLGVLQDKLTPRGSLGYRDAWQLAKLDSLMRLTVTTSARLVVRSRTGREVC